MEHDYGYQYGTAARKQTDDIEVPYFVTPEYQRAKREREIREQKLAEARRQRELAEREQARREYYRKTGRHANQIASQHNRENARANRAKSKNNLRAFAIKMAALILISTSIATGIDAVANADKKIEEDKNNIKIEYNIGDNNTEANPEISILYPEPIFEEAEEIIHHYETENLNRENLAADDFCENLDQFLASDQPLIGDNLEEKTWNLLYNQVGCSGEQSAAILGNMIVEDPSLNPFQHQVFDNMDDTSSTTIVNNSLGIGPFQFSGDRKKAFLKFVRDHADYGDLYDKFTSPKIYGATSQTNLFDTDLSRYGLAEEDCDRGLKCIFAYVSYEMQYPNDAHYNRNQWNKFITNEEDSDKSTTDLAIQFAQFFERTDSGYERRADNANEIYSKYVTRST